MSDTPTTFADALGTQIPPNIETIDLEAKGEAYLADAILRSRRDYWAFRTPTAYREDFDLARVAVFAGDAHRPAYDNTAALRRVLEWKVSPRGLLLSGPQGRGKTRAAFALCKRLLCEESVNVAIWSASDFFAELQTFVRYGNDEAADFINRQASRPVFFLDDFGQQALLRSREEWAQAWFFRFLDLRLGHALPLILTTNQSGKQMAGEGGDYAGDPLLRRLLAISEPVKFS